MNMLYMMRKTYDRLLNHWCSICNRDPETMYDTMGMLTPMVCGCMSREIKNQHRHRYNTACFNKKKIRCLDTVKIPNCLLSKT